MRSGRTDVGAWEATPSVVRDLDLVIEEQCVGPFPLPATDPLPLWELGVHGVPLPQYLRWADDVGLIAALASQPVLSLEELIARTPLTHRGVDALLGILCGLQLVRRVDDEYALSAVGREYLDRGRPYYIGGSLYGALQAPLPPQLRKGESVRRYSRFTGTLRDAIRYRRKPNQFGRPEQLQVQHSRNLPAAVVAIGRGLFDGIRHLGDIGGGSGAFAIPLVLQRPDTRVTLVDLPRALPHIRRFLVANGVERRIELLGLNIHHTPWPLTGCDGLLFGNMLHFCDDDECLALLRESARILPPGGCLVLHEMLWHDDRNGPLLTALWNFWMATFSAGRQRTFGDIAGMLARAGFADATLTPTLGGFSAIRALNCRGGVAA